MEARKTVTSDRAPLFQNRLRKSPGGGRGLPTAHRGQGRIKERTGKGSHKATSRDKGKADADPDSDQ